MGAFCFYMAIPHAEKLLEKAQSGVRLTPNERRHCVAFLMATRPHETNSELGKTFGVSEKMIRKDKDQIRGERAKLIKEDDIGLVISDIVMCLENQVRDIERSKGKASAGTKAYLDHCRAIFNMKLESVKALQELGYYPRNLGNMVVEKFEYRATVGRDGSVDTRPVNLLDNENIIEAEFEEQKQIVAAALS